MNGIPRWFSDTKEGHSAWYIQRFRTMAEDGADLAGEARLIDAIVAPGSRVLDAGCGPGRVGAELYGRGHDVVGVDVDPELIAAAKADHPGPQWHVGDLSNVTLASMEQTEPFDAAVIAGNVMAFVAPDTEAAVLAHVGRCVRSDGQIVIGFGLDRGYELSVFDADVEKSGLRIEQRFATWDVRPFGDDSNFAVTILRVP